jgi:polyhydroxyalkanoate synthesis regulator phasin
MNATDLTKLLQKGFYVTLGATASLLETLQDPNKREQNLSSLRQDIDTRSQELAEKGAATEAEARNFVDTFLSRKINQPTSSTSDQDFTSVTTVTTTATNVADQADKDVPADLKELTQQIADLRAELESLRQKDN